MPEVYEDSDELIRQVARHCALYDQPKQKSEALLSVIKAIRLLTV